MILKDVDDLKMAIVVGLPVEKVTFKGLRKLKTLSLKNLTNLVDAPHLKNLPNLQTMTLTGNTKLRRLPRMDKLRSLTSLDLSSNSMDDLPSYDCCLRS